jgi:hypothetical protein
LTSDESVRSYIYPVSTGTQIGTLTNHDLLLMTNSAERMRIDSSGNVGIGTSSPVGRLSVLGTDNTTQAVFSGATGTTGRGLRIAVNQRGGTFNLDAILDAQATVGVAGNLVFQTQSIERMRIDSSGRVTMPYQPAFPS